MPIGYYTGLKRGSCDETELLVHCLRYSPIPTNLHSLRLVNPDNIFFKILSMEPRCRLRKTWRHTFLADERKLIRSQLNK